ncbi:hypothetical protein BV25DRAFT_1234924 [Artomyces pyxidatus]|uniref:Uncharacterized protein n=1 Tax=Artomyces pyxidatus TaxID=48021 RepID=A0ACB8SR85_9AGAM|nr:hypothetical protein BV25DRAFT_1234924 [Artomyces pyxidatus]
MGVHGLSTYLRENQRSLAKTLVFSPAFEEPLNLVVDGWSFIYELYNQSRLFWAFGGEYRSFFDLVQGVVRAWVRVGLQPYFVFDGPYSESKFTTVSLRVSQGTIQPSLLFFRTSAASRATPRFMRENSILPPSCYAVTLQALRALGDAVEILFADGEGDPFAVELAGLLGGYVTGHDSDFVILHAEGYAGYIPMDQMVWSLNVDQAPAPQDDGGFVAARRPKTRDNTQQSGQGLIPPEVLDDVSLTCTVFSPSALATHFRLPITILPLLAALVGNDFTADRRPVHTLFFERDMTVSQRINRVANALTTVATVASGVSQKKIKKPITSVVDYIDAAVDTLLVRPSSSMGSGEKDAIVEKTVEAALQYAIPRHQCSALYPTSACALHNPDVCPLIIALTSPFLEDNNREPPARAHVRAAYITAYRRGLLTPRIMDAYNTGTVWPRLFLEDPDLETVSRSIGRPITEWVYSILDEGLGLPDHLTGEEENEEGDEEDDEDELIDVVEEDSEDELDDGDPLAPLQGALQELHTGIRPAPSTSSTTPSSQAPPKIVLEYVRRGTRFVEEEVTVKPLSRLLSSLGSPHGSPSDAVHTPVQLLEDDVRFSIFLQILGSELPSVRELLPIQVMPVLALRWVVRRLHHRAAEATAGTDREKEKWTQNEARAFLTSFAWTEASESSTLPPLVNRNIQLFAQVSAALSAIEMLAQALLVVEHVPTPMHLFSGSMFHSVLTGERQVGDKIPEGMWDACVDGLGDAFGIERGKKGKKERKAAVAAGRNGVGIRPSGSKAGVSQSLFGMLAGMDDE